jgi:hypothetical protein
MIVGNFQKGVDFLEWFVLASLDFHRTPNARDSANDH